MNQRVIYPFTAIVGQERMRRALVLNAVDPRIGGVLIRGERGTAKSTAARALAALLPEEEAIEGCRFGCDPHDPTHWCTECIERAAASKEPLPIIRRPTPFINLPVSATEDRVVGTLDIERAIQKGERHFEPGVLAAANRGLLYIDEVNLLDDHVVDILLDSAAMGMNIVEREGISFSHPARFILVGTMNPEEGDLRPQLLDRFALSVDIRGIPDARARVEIMQRNIAFEQDPVKFREAWLPREQALSERIHKARALVDEVTYTTRDLLIIADLTASLEVDGHRADLVILKAARAQAAFDGRTRIVPNDIALAAELALPHRVKAGPFRRSDIGVEALEERIEQLKEQAAVEAEQTPSDEDDEGKKKTGSEQERISLEPDDLQVPVGEAQQQVFTELDAHWWDGGKVVKPGEPFETRQMDTPLDEMVRKHGGRRSETYTDRKRGRYIKARPSPHKADDLAFDATFRAAAPFQRQRSAIREKENVAFAVRSEDFQKKVRVKKTGNLILFLVDGSWSMAVAERMQATKSAIFSLLKDAYQRRDRVGLIVFQKDRATLVLAPTNSVLLAQRALADIPVGGKTPLAAGLKMAYEIITREKILHPDVQPLLIVLTDGAGNVPMGNKPVKEEIKEMANLFAKEDIHSVVINMEAKAFDTGLAQELAEMMGGVCYTLEEIKGETLYNTVQKEMRTAAS